MAYDIIDPWKDVAERQKVRFYSRSAGGVTGLLPSTFRQTFSNTWQAPFADMLASFNVGIQAAQELFALGNRVDYAGTLKEISTRIWAGGSPMSVGGLALLYVSRDSAFNDVMEPVRRLLQMASASTALTKSVDIKGRSISATVLKRPDTVEVELGYVSRLRDAVIDDISVEWSNITDAEGISVWAMVTLSLSTRRVYLSDDEDVQFNTRGFNLAPGL